MSLLPAEHAECNHVYNYGPDSHHTQLWAKIYQMLTLCRYQSGAVNHRCQRHVGGDILQPVRHEVPGEKCTAQEHHRKRNDVGQRRHLAFVLRPAAQGEADAKYHNDTKYQEYAQLCKVAYNLQMEYEHSYNEHESE